MKLLLVAMVQLGFMGFVLTSPTLDTENTVSLSVRTELSQRCATVCRICTNGPNVWDCCACGNCCTKT
jgi:hypothetical protein